MKTSRFNYNEVTSFNYKKITFLICLVFLTVLNISCSVKYQIVDSSLKKRLINDLVTGNAQLDCAISCLHSWVTALPHLKRLHDGKQWKQLALEVQKIGRDSDLDWYYLGRAAEGLGAVEAALTYYDTSIENSRSGYRCAKSSCNNMDFPSDSLKRKRLIRGGLAKKQDNTPTYSLFVDVQPSDAVIKIINIEPKFTQGIQLAQGEYQLRLQKRGFKTINKIIEISDSEEALSFNMIPIKLVKSGEANFALDDENQNLKSQSTSQKYQITNNTATAIVIKNTELKTQPTLFASVNGKLKRGEKVNILETIGDWVKVKTTQGEGYIYSDSLR